MHNIWRGKRGTTLIEILVVMVVLLIGIMTLIQMFPTGFRVVKAGESQTIATRLAQQELERWKSMAANLPDAIVPVMENGAVEPKESPLSPFMGWYKEVERIDGKDVVSFRRGNALNFRQVFGEYTLMPALSVFGGISTSRYTLAFGPIDATSVKIKGRDLMRVGLSTLSKAGQYKIDYSLSNGKTFQIYFPSDRASKRFYYVNYSFWAVQGTGNPELFNVEQTVNLPDGGWTAGWHNVDVPVPNGYTVVGIEQESDSVTRGFYQVGSFSTDFYEFRIADPIAGTIDFNTYAQGEFDYTPLGLQPLAARIDYQIYDPRIMREDRIVPSAPLGGKADPETGSIDIPIKMSLRFILNLGDPEDVIKNRKDPADTEEVTYKGILPSFPYSAYVIDLATGYQVLLPGRYLADVKAGGTLDYKTGTISIPSIADLRDPSGGAVQSKVSMVGRHLRFYYRAEGDWTVQCQKACTSYTRASDLANMKYNRYFLQSPNRLIFSKYQLEQTVMVDCSYSDGPTGSEHRLPSNAYQIQQDPTGLAFVDLPLPADSSGKVTAVIKRISVVGVSFKARVLWRDGTVWRKVDLDTTLTPAR